MSNHGPMKDGNAVTLLENGSEIFPAMLEAIRRAERTICLETYVYWSGDIAVEFAEALAQRSRSGVKVHVLIDWYGSIRMKEELIDVMKDGGVEVVRFRPFKWFQLNFYRTNHRTHRKLLITDGKTAFTGGVGIADEWTGNAQDPEHWRDNHYQIEGPVVADIQQAFLNNWKEAEGYDNPQESDESYFPKLEPAGDVRAKVVSASPLNGGMDIYEMFRRAISEAQTSLDLVTAYFVPGDGLLAGLTAASKRGVKVRILVGGPHTDETLVRYASRHQWGQLLKDGIRIFEYRPTLLHVKGLIVDQTWASVGSANFDARSCRLNDELNLTIYSEAFIKEQVKVFSKDCEHAHELTVEEWKARPVTTKCLDWLAVKLRPLL